MIRKLSRRCGLAMHYGRQYGFKAMLGLVRQRMRRGDLFAKPDAVADYAFVLPRPAGRPLSDDAPAANTINWFVPPFARGLGGHLNIFRFVHNLEALGFDCRIVIIGEPQPLSAEQAQRDLRAWFFPLKANIYLGAEAAPPAHVSIATAWPTAYAVRDFQATRHRCYFVQDFEPWFYGHGSEYALAEATYRFGFLGITAGGWLRDKLAAEYGMTTHAVGFSYDHDRYRPLPRPSSEGRKVFFYARPSTPRRGFELGMLALDAVARRLPDVTAVLAGWDLSGHAVPFKHVNPGVAELDDLPALYAQCDAALVLSFSNLSLLPLELMACGVPVVSNRALCTTWLLTDDNACLAEPTPEALSDALVGLLENTPERDRLRQAGLAAARATDWTREAARMAELLRGLT